VTDEQFQDAEYKKLLRSWSWYDFPRQIQTRYKIDLKEVVVLSRSHHEVLALWSNYTEKRRRRQIEREITAVGLKQLIKDLSEDLSDDGPGSPIEPKWWYSMNNPVFI